MPVTVEEAKQKIAELVAKYEKLSPSAVKAFNEANTKQGFIEPLFKALGWDVDDTDEVTLEENASKGWVDYAFKLHGVSRFYLEAKPLKADLNNPEYIKQAVTYAYSKGVTWVALTDFEELRLFNAQQNKPFITLKCQDYLATFDKLWLLSRDSLAEGLLNKEAAQYGALPPSLPIETRLFTQFRQWREELFNQLHGYHDDFSPNLIDEVVQRFFDRLIFIRTCEDRKLEDNLLLASANQWKEAGHKGELIEALRKVFDKYRDIYDSELFDIHETDKAFIEGQTLENILHGLYEIPGSLANYDFSIIGVDVLGTVYEQYLGYVATKVKERVEAQLKLGITDEETFKVIKKKQRRKEQGIYYTPTFVTDYIVKETVGRFIIEHDYNEIRKIKILDPACGSGSFLIRAYDELLTYHAKEQNKSLNELEQKDRLPVLLANIYGVDLDRQAVEITRLNLLLRTLTEKRKLPYLSGNVRPGNSLISGTEEELKKYFGTDWQTKKPFNWNEEFKDIMAQGGFDVVIGNPPYGAEFGEPDKDYFYNNFQTSEYQLDSYMLFFERALTVLKDNGLLGFIVPNPWLTNINVTKLRRHILATCKILEITNYPAKVFQATVDTVVVIMQKQMNYQERITNEIKVKIGHEYTAPELTHAIPQVQWEKADIFNMFVDASSSQLLERIRENTLNLKAVCNVVVGIKPYQVDKGQPKQTKEIVGSRIFDATHKKDDTYRRYIRGSDINRYRNQWNQTHWISYGKWLAEPRKIENFNAKEKIIIRQTGDSLIANLDQEQFLCLNNTHTINVVDSQYDLRYVLALINSHLMDYYYQSLNPEKGEALAEVKATNVKQLPIRRINFSSPAEKKMHDKLVTLVDKMLELNKKLASIQDTYSDERDELLSQIKKTDKEIDNLVYDLYRLTEEEKQVIESSVSKA